MNTNFFSVDKLRMNDFAVQQTGTFRCRQHKPQNEAQLQYVIERKPAQTPKNLFLQ